jgi:hypothetical protein
VKVQARTGNRVFDQYSPVPHSELHLLDTADHYVQVDEPPHVAELIAPQ